MLLNNLLFILSPLEGFKTDAYVKHFYYATEILSGYHSWFDDLPITFGLSYSVSLIDFVILFSFYFALRYLYIAQQNHFFEKSVIILSLLFIFFYWNSVNTFVATNFSMITDILKENTFVYEVRNVTLFTIKDFITFLTIAFFVYSLSNASLTDTYIFADKFDDALAEFIYKGSLGMFANTLELKHNHDVRNYQEIFVKIHGILLFILWANLVGMIPYSTTITASLINTLFISLAVFINILILIVREKGIAHFFSLFLPSGCPFYLVFLLVPIEVVSYSFRLVSLSVRLFANMMAGHTLLKVIGGFSWSLLLLGDFFIIVHYVPFFVLFLLTLLEIGVALIQTYVFITLSYIYLRDIFVAH